MTISIPTQSFSTTDLLALTNYRIASILNGAQAYSSSGRQLTNADLGELMSLRKQLEYQVQIEADAAIGGGNVLVQIGQEQ